MKRRARSVIALVAGIMLCLVMGILQAQEEEEMEYSYGTVNTVSSEQIVVTEYDYEQEKDVNIAYTITPETKIEGVNSIKDIAAGDIIEIDYMVKKGRNIAKNIFVEKPAPKKEIEEPAFSGEMHEFEETPEVDFEE